MLMIQHPHMKGALLVFVIPTNYDVFMISYPHAGGAPLICVLPTNQEMLAISYARTKSALVISAHGGCASDSCRTNQPRNADDSISAREKCACGSCRVLMMSQPHTLWFMSCTHDVTAAHGVCSMDHKGALVISAHGG